MLGSKAAWPGQSKRRAGGKEQQSDGLRVGCLPAGLLELTPSHSLPVYTAECGER
jgi:hypothetical protein